MRSFFRKLVAPPKERPSASSGIGPLLVGVALFGVLFRSLIWPEIAVGVYWAPTPCTVLDTRVGESHSSDDSTYRPEILIRYEYQGKTSDLWSTYANEASSGGKDSKIEEIQRFPPGPSYTCWVNPSDPTKAVILRGFGGDALALLIPLLFIAMGLRPIYYAFTLRKKSREEIHQSSQVGTKIYIPPAASEPGVQLPFRLRHEKNIGGNLFLFGWAIFMSFLEVALIAVLVSASVSGFGFAVLLSVIVVLGLIVVLMWHELFTSARVALRVPPALLEISASPVRPGVPFDLFIEQPKPFKFATFSVNLICEEAATFGKNSESLTTETHEAYTQSILDAQSLVGEGQRPFVHRGRVVVPANAMHSLDAPYNKITWKFVISGHTTTGVKFRRELPVIVHPPKPERATGYRDKSTS